MSGIVGSYFNTRGSGVVAKLGTDGQVFTSTGAGLSQGFEAAAAGGSITKLSTVDASGAATVDFTSLIDSTYKKYIVAGTSIVTSADDGQIEVLVSTDNGSSWESSAYDTQGWCGQAGSLWQALTNTDNGANMVCGGYAAGNAGGESLTFEFYCDDPNSTSLYKLFRGNATNFRTDGQLVIGNFAGNWNSTAAYNAIRIDGSSAVTMTGRFTLYGVTT